MDLEHLRDYCLKKRFVTEHTPFGPDTLVFKVHNKMFALCSIDNFTSVNLKCDPELAQELRANYIAVKPGYHMNKVHWNTVDVNQDVDDTHFLQHVDNSYMLVVKSLPKKLQATIL
ncbi:MAG: MmcQ/YjbR family DNA-binding protein [Bacteroidia bacterium]|jgi:predicted DNA-binding protein (MmcQ/YjbR family)|nr:MmcQ/YjbR family DNA-binding protein [Bacteroidia bacterium]